MPAKTFAEILKADPVEKYNPYHDARGRFTTADAATLFTIRTQDPNKQFLANEGIRREQARHEADLNGPRMKAVHDIEDKIRSQDFESAGCVDKDGKVLFFKNGEQSEVSFTKEERELCRGNTLTHNHPSSSMFSPQDVDYFLEHGLQEIRATNREGITYSLSRGKNFQEGDADSFSFLYKMSRLNAMSETQHDMDSHGFQQKLNNGEMTKAQADKEFRRIMAKNLSEFWTNNASDFNLEFYVEKRKVTKSAGAELTATASDGEIVFTLDKDEDAWYKAAFEEWYNKAVKTEPTRKGDTMDIIHEIDEIEKESGDFDLDNTGEDVQETLHDTPTEEPQEETTKSAPKSVLFIGLKITGADSLAIEGGEDTDDFHVTLAYGHFDQNSDDDDVDARVQHAIDDIRELIPDTIHFDAIRRFAASESSDGMDVIYAQVAAGQLEEAHDGLLKALKDHGIELEDTFPEYKPHMTLAYIDPKVAYDLGEIDANGTATKVMIGHGHESTKENNYTIAKMDDDKRLVFGWASISYTADGEHLEDLQHDLIDPEDMEESAYEYVLNFRDTGELHNPNLRKKGKLVESVVFTAEKMKAMGIPEGILPIGWWVGFKIDDDEAWEKVKNGTYKMFSVEGTGQRVPIE